MHAIRWLPILLTAALCAGAARAQGFAEAVQAMARQRPDLNLPSTPEPFDGRLRMALHKPAGDGPFAALVVVHSCGGLRDEIGDWVREALAHGYAVLVLDALTPRGVREVCIPSASNAGLHGVRGAADVLQATDHLARLPFIDGRRIGVLGFSWGAIVGLLASGKSYADALTSGQRHAAFVGLYPICFLPAALTPSKRDVDYVRPDHQPPGLVLLAGRDTEAPPQDCVDRLKAARERGAPLEWHLYPDATHCWDCRTLDGMRKTDFRGVAVSYRYDKDLTADSMRRAFELFDRTLKPR